MESPKGYNPNRRLSKKEAMLKKQELAKKVGIPSDSEEYRKWKLAVSGAASEIAKTHHPFDRNGNKREMGVNERSYNYDLALINVYQEELDIRAQERNELDKKSKEFQRKKKEAMGNPDAYYIRKTGMCNYPGTYTMVDCFVAEVLIDGKYYEVFDKARPLDQIKKQIEMAINCNIGKGFRLKYKP